jgi:hypothetical protein
MSKGNAGLPHLDPSRGGGGRPRALADNNAIIRFHGCAMNGRDDDECNNEVVRHLMQYGLTQRQAVFAVLAPRLFLGQDKWRRLLASNGNGSIADQARQSCKARLCIYAPAGLDDDSTVERVTFS